MTSHVLKLLLSITFSSFVLSQQDRFDAKLLSSEGQSAILGLASDVEKP